MKNEYGLKRIVLIDSFLPGRRYVVNVDGNTGITGDNGRGKTSLIRLPVIFYGERPAKIGIKQNNELKLKGFSGWYLPRNGSYVIFEYLSEGKKRCAVFLPDSKTEEGICRYFIESGYDDSLFFDSSIERPCSKEQFMKNLNLKNIRYHSPHSYEQYRRILLDGDVKGQRHFSMVPARAKLSQLHELFGGMLKRETDFSMLCKIIENWAHRGIGEDSKSALSSFSLDRAKLKSWIIEYDAQKTLQKRASQDAIKQAKAHFDSYKFSCGKISAVISRAEAWKNKSKLDLDDLRKDHDAKQKDIADQIDIAIKKINEIKATIEHLGIQTSKSEAALNGLTQQKKHYEEKIGDDYQSKLNELEECRKQLKFSIDQKETLSNAAVKIEEWFKDKKRALEKRFDDDRATYKSQLNELQAVKKDGDHQRDMLSQKEISEAKEQHNLDRSTIVDEINEISQDLVRLETASLNPKLPDDLGQRQSLLVESRDNLQEELSRLNDERDSRSKVKNDRTAAYEEINKALNDIDNQRDEIESELETANAKLYAHENSLLSYVRKNVAEWDSTFARVVRKEVLLRTNLKPVLTTEDSSTIFGVQIENDLLPAAEDFDEDKLIKEVKALSEEFEAIEKEYRKTEILLKEAHLESDKARTSMESNESKLSMLRPKIKDNKNQISRIEIEISRWVEHYKLSLQSEVEEKKGYIAELRIRLGNVNNSLDESIAKIKDRAANEASESTNSFTTAKNAIQNDIASVDKKESLAFESLNETRNAKLDEKGVNKALLDKLSKDIDKNSKKVNALLNLRELVETYQTFLKVEYASYSHLKSDHQNHCEQLKRSKEIEREISRKRELLVEQQSADKSLYAKESAKISSDIITLRALIKSNNYIASVLVEDVDITLDQVSSAYELKDIYEEALKERDNAEEATRSILGPIKKVFTDERNQGTSLHDYFSNSATSTTSLVGLGKVIFEYVDNDSQRNDIRILRNNLNDLDKLNNYVSYINNFANQITAFSKALDEHMTQISSFESLEKLSASIHFGLMDENSWKDMKRLSDSYKKWRDQESGGYALGELQAELPSQELFDSIQDYDENASNDELSTDDLAQFIDFRIEFEDQGTKRVVKSHKLLKHASSNARSYLILVVIFIGFVNMIRGKSAIPLVWAVDELRDISVNNIEKLVHLLSQNNISLISACPDVDEHIFEIFDQTYEIYKLDCGRTVFAEIVPETTTEVDFEEIIG